jgi:hypothetical protein
MAENSIAAGGPRSVKRITDPKALRALAHPIRMSLIGLLRTEGPLTATRAAELLGENSATTSFHLRQLAKYGMAEEAPGGQGRERPWQATAQFTDVPDVADNPEFAAASSLFRSVLAERHFGSLMSWLEARPDESAEWQDADHFSDWLLYLTASELADLRDKVRDLIDSYLDRTARPELRPEGARLINFLQLAFPMVGPSTTGPSAGRGPTGDSRPADDSGLSDDAAARGDAR